MKIAICVSKLTGGGAERVASLWAKGFCQQGNEVCVIITDKKAPITYEIPREVKIFNIGINGTNRVLNYFKNKFIKKIVFPKRLHKVFLEFDPDIVIAVLPSWGPKIFKARGDLKFKVIGTDHNAYEYPAYVPMPNRKKNIKFKTNLLFDYVTVLTQADVDYIGDRLPNVSALPNPLVFDQIDYSPKRQKRILAVGRLNAWYYKGFDILINAYGKIAKSFPEWELCIMGDGSEENIAMLKKLALENGIEKNFKILPFQSDPLPEYRKSEVFCLSSRYEGFGLVLVEAMSQGCACVACDFKGRQKEIINDDTCGITCEAGDIDALANALQKMLGDATYRKNVGEAAIERSKHYNLDRIMERWDDIIHKIYG